MRTSLLCVLGMAAGFSLSAVAGEPSDIGKLFGGEKFEKPEYQTSTVRCDNGGTVMRVFEGELSDTRQDPDTFFWMVIEMAKGSRIYVYSPNPRSMSPITFSFIKDKDGDVREISRPDRDAIMSQDTPNLHAHFNQGKSDCVKERRTSHSR